MAIEILYGTASYDEFVFLATDTSQYMIRARRGDDYIRTGVGDDDLRGGSGHDRIYSGEGDDVIRGGSGDDYIDAGHGDDRVLGGSGNDTLKGVSGNDFVAGGSGNDVIYGVKGANDLRGGAGNDVLHSGTNSSKLNGGKGDDHLIGDLAKGGRHDMRGADGADVFEFISVTDARTSFLRIRDFELGIDTLIYDDQTLAELVEADAFTLRKDGGRKTSMVFEEGDEILFNKIKIADFQAFIDGLEIA